MASSSEPPLDYSYKSLESFEDLKLVKPRKKGNRREAASGLFYCAAIKLSHNSISSLQGLFAGLSEVVYRPELVGWLDLSFNGLEEVVAPGESESDLLRLSSLKLLYLHGNRISRLQAIRPLAKLPLLFSLTLHGNPLDQRDKYRVSVLALLPQISSLDQSKVTDRDRCDSAQWAKRHLPLTT